MPKTERKVGKLKLTAFNIPTFVDDNVLDAKVVNNNNQCNIAGRISNFPNYNIFYLCKTLEFGVDTFDFR